MRRQAASTRLREFGFSVESHESVDATRKSVGETGTTAGLLAVYVPPPVTLELQRAELVAVYALHHSFMKASVLCMSTEEAVTQAAKALGVPILFYDAVADLGAQIRALASGQPPFVRQTADHRALTPREESVLIGLKAGIPLKEIAANLGVSTKTVSTYKVRLMQKLGYETNADLLQGTD